MAEPTTRSRTGGTPPGETLRSFSKHAVEAHRELNDRAADLAAASAAKLEDQASGLAKKDMAAQAPDKFKESASEKNAGADYVSSLAETIRRAGREFDNDLPLAGTYIRKAASQVENVAGSIRTGGFNELVRNAQSLARRQPTAFIGIAAIAGFAAVRFLKSSSGLPQ